MLAAFARAASPAQRHILMYDNGNSLACPACRFRKSPRLPRARSARVCGLLL